MDTYGGRIRVGTCSWQDPTLVRGGGFYPPGMSPGQMISYYAQWFDVVEVDASYYYFLSRNTFARWAERTPPGFLFNVKVPGIFTHQGMPIHGLPRDVQQELDEATRKKSRIYLYHLVDELAEGLWTYFRQTVEPLVEAGKLGWLLFQFPPYFRYSPQRASYLLSCRERLPDHVLAVEFRAADWFRDPQTGEDRREETLSFLEQNQLAFVAVDEPQGTASSVPPVFAVTHPRYAIIRFHGRKVETWGKNVAPHLKFDWEYSEEELREWLPPILGASQAGVEVHAKFNTNNGNQGIVNSLRMKKLLGQITAERYQRAVAALYAAQREHAVREAGRRRRSL